jgi:hypothetical protein
MQTCSTRYPDRYEIPIRPRSVSRVYVDSGFDLEFFDHTGQTGVRIENPIAVVTENPRLLVRRDGSEESPFGKIVVSSTALRSGKVLEIVFAPGVRFWVQPHMDADAWGPYGTQGLVVVCLPGSEMAIWFGRKKPASLAAVPEGIPPEAVTRSAIIE